MCVQNERVPAKTSISAEVDQVELEAGDFITSFDYLMEKEALIVGTSDGLLQLHGVDGNSTEVVGKVEGGVKCISPSPDGDLLAVISGFGQVLVMTHDWDLLYENPLEDLPEGVDVRKDLFPFFSDYLFSFSVQLLKHGAIIGFWNVLSGQ